MNVLSIVNPFKWYFYGAITLALAGAGTYYHHHVFEQGVASMQDKVTLLTKQRDDAYDSAKISYAAIVKIQDQMDANDKAAKEQQAIADKAVTDSKKAIIQSQASMKDWMVKYNQAIKGSDCNGPMLVLCKELQGY